MTTISKDNYIASDWNPGAPAALIGELLTQMEHPAFLEEKPLHAIASTALDDVLKNSAERLLE